MTTGFVADIASAFVLVHDDPVRAEALATDVLEHTGDQRTAIEARWARGMARRERGTLQEGAADLARAHELASSLGDPALAARIAVTRALVLLHTRSADEALAMLERASGDLEGADLARLETQRGLVLHRVGDLDAAERHYERARRRFDQFPDPFGQARLLNNLTILFAQRGRLDLAEIRATEALQLADSIGQRFIGAGARHNRGFARARDGRLADAMDDIRRAEQVYFSLGRHDLVHVARVDLAEVLLAANLLEEAVDVADRALTGVQQHGTETDLADALLLAGRCRAAVGRGDDARSAAQQAVELLRRQQRSSLVPVAEFTALTATPDRMPHESPTALDELAGRLRANGWWLESIGATVLSAQSWVRESDPAAATLALTQVGPARRLPAAERSGLAVVRSLIAEAEGDRRRARRTISAGLRTVAENQASLTSFELRAFAAGHGDVLRSLGAKMAIADRRPRELLTRLEATRGRLVATSWSDTDARLTELLARLRATTGELRAASVQGKIDEGLRRRQLELEHAIRDHARRHGSLGVGATGTIADAIAALGDRCLLEYAVVDEHLWVVSVSAGRARLHDLGTVAGLRDDIDSCTFALSRLNREGGSTAGRAAAAETLSAIGAALQERLVPPEIRRRDTELVVVPDGPLHGVAWRAVLRPRRRPVSVTPSLLSWAMAATRASEPEPPGGWRVSLVAGPDLPGAVAEVQTVARDHRRPAVITGPAATADRVLKAFEDADLLHLACHGSFRSDNPLFSTLTVHDGAINVHDLQRCARLPRTIVLSACNVATSAVLRGGTLLGLSSALMAFGVANVVAPLTPVNDQRVVEVMVDLHRRLAAGDRVAAALAGVSTSEAADPTADAFIALGG